jgi:hypothetical protein
LGLAHPHSPAATDQAFHWARLAAQTDPSNVTLFFIPDQSWCSNAEPYHHPFPNTHVVAHFEVDTLFYHEPTIPKESSEKRTEPLAIKLLCVHHQLTPMDSLLALQTLCQLAINLGIPPPYVCPAPPTPLPITINSHRY